ncbi:MAG: sigma-54 dependent transcriptional regulator [Pirellulales bacterium]|nr:sigma-54 dependent transcriptional regulator [Pirellulales bacterium]
MAKRPARILVCSPAGLSLPREELQRVLRVEWVHAPSTTEALRLAADTPCDLIIATHAPPTFDALELLGQALASDPAQPVIILDETPSVPEATQCLRRGAADYLAFPVGEEDLVAAVERVLRDRRRDAENRLLRRQVERTYAGFSDIIGASPPMQKVFGTIERLTGSSVDVLILGPTGTGKELIARAIHRRSPRAAQPFVPIDCGAIPENLIESELFGHERGAFTGAEARRIGLLEFADGGTIFLDELGELPLPLQAKLLRALQERKIRRVGGREELDVDLRVIAATSRDLDAMIRQGQFRQDLYYRVNVVRIDLPPLCQRGDDLGLLAEYFLHKHARETGRMITGFSPEAYQVLKQYPWPGNIRELQNAIRRALALTQGNKIEVDDLPDEIVVAAGTRGEAVSDKPQGYFALRDQHVARYELQYLSDLLARHHGDVPAAAREAKLPRGTLYRLLKNHALEPEDFR